MSLLETGSGDIAREQLVQEMKTPQDIGIDQIFLVAEDCNIFGNHFRCRKKEKQMDKSKELTPMEIAILNFETSLQWLATREDAMKLAELDYKNALKRVENHRQELIRISNRAHDGS